MEAWRKTFRDGVAPQLSDAGLGALRQGLLADDPGLIQGATSSPPPLNCTQDWPVEGACPIGYCFWKGDKAETVGEVEEGFAKVCFATDQAMGEPAACRYFLNVADGWSRKELVDQLLPEVELEIERRRSCQQPAKAAG